MEISDEELEWREQIHDAQRADFERQQRANRPFWQIILVQIWATSWQLALGIAAMALLLYLGIKKLMDALVIPLMNN